VKFVGFPTSEKLLQLPDAPEVMMIIMMISFKRLLQGD
jgi:hypothetical protein